jgi:hypothetical protein
MFSCRDIQRSVNSLAGSLSAATALRELDGHRLSAGPAAKLMAITWRRASTLPLIASD